MDKFRKPNYADLRKMVNTGDRLACHAYTPTGGAIRAITGDFFNHECNIIRYSEFESLGVDLVDVIEATAKGLVRKPFSEWLADYPGQVFWGRIRAEFDDKRTLYGRELLKLRNTEYDFADCLRCAVTKVEADDERLFCSEASYIAGVRATLPVPNGWNPRMAPVPGRQITNLNWADPLVRIK